MKNIFILLGVLVCTFGNLSLAAGGAEEETEQTSSPVFMGVGISEEEHEVWKKADTNLQHVAEGLEKWKEEIAAYDIDRSSRVSGEDASIKASHDLATFGCWVSEETNRFLAGRLKNIARRIVTQEQALFRARRERLKRLINDSVKNGSVDIVRELTQILERTTYFQEIFESSKAMFAYYHITKWMNSLEDLLNTEKETFERMKTAALEGHTFEDGDSSSAPAGDSADFAGAAGGGGAAGSEG